MRSENKSYEGLMISYHRALINKDMAFYRDNQTGYLATVFRQYLDSSMTLVRFFRGEALGTAVSLVAPVVVLTLADIRLGLVTLAMVVVQVIYVMWSSAKANKYRSWSHEIYRKITGEVSDEITNIVAFKSGGIEATANSRLAELAREETRTFGLRRTVTTLLDLPRGIITAIGMTAAVFLIIGSADGNDPAAIGLMVLTLTYLFQILRNVSTLPELVQTHDDAMTKIQPTLRYLGDEYETITDPAEPAELRIVKGAIRIKDVAFSYESKSDKGHRMTVFEHLDMEIAGGEQVGVVGLSGAGKSTLANLLMRFDELGSGTITIDGTDIRTVRQADLRQAIAYVPQEPILFHRTVRENIAYYNPDASDADIERAARAAHAHGFITLLPDGYDTLVGERGVKLSGGQKQRVAIARAIMKQASIIVFDEATSALDSESEQIIQRALPEILGKKTALVIAHRLSTVAGLDRIIVMHDGQVAEQGSHVELLSHKGRYYKLWQRQTSGNIEA